MKYFTPFKVKMTSLLTHTISRGFLCDVQLGVGDRISHGQQVHLVQPGQPGKMSIRQMSSQRSRLLRPEVIRVYGDTLVVASPIRSHARIVVARKWIIQFIIWATDVEKRIVVIVGLFWRFRARRAAFDRDVGRCRIVVGSDERVQRQRGDR